LLGDKRSWFAPALGHAKHGYSRVTRDNSDVEHARHHLQACFCKYLAHDGLGESRSLVARPVVQQRRAGRLVLTYLVTLDGDLRTRGAVCRGGVPSVPEAGKGKLQGDLISPALSPCPRIGENVSLYGQQGCRAYSASNWLTSLAAKNESYRLHCVSLAFAVRKRNEISGEPLVRLVSWQQPSFLGRRPTHT